MSSADILSWIILLMVGVAILVSYWMATLALFSETVASSREIYGRRPIAATLLGMAVLLPITAIAAALEARAPNSAVDIPVIGELMVLGLIALLGCSGLADRIGAGLAGCNTSSWRTVAPGGAILALTFLLPFIGWYLVLPCALASGFGIATMQMWRRAFPLRTHIASHTKQATFALLLGGWALTIMGCGLNGGSSSPPAPQPGPAVFTKRPQPVWSGTYVAGDPCVIHDGSLYRMYYTSVDFIASVEHIMIATAISSDGINWTKVNPTGESISLDVSNSWDKFLETSEVIKVGSQVWMWYSGYPAEASVIGKTVANGEIGMAKSNDGISFTRIGAGPVLTRGGSTSRDYNALYSPSVVFEGGLYYMLYTGWAIDDSPATPFIGILGATSPDGVTWTKRAQPVLNGPDVGLSWAPTITEVDLTKGPDGLFYIFFSTDNGLGMAKGPTPFGPWDIRPTPILTKELSWESEKIIAPSVIIENGKIRLWYMGVVGAFSDFSIGYAEAPFPFTWGHAN